MVQPGDLAPNFTALDDRGQQVSLADYHGSPVVLYFYPKNNTPGCTREACEFRDLHKELTDRGAVVLGVSPDSVSSHSKFRQRHGLPFRLISDEQRQLAETYGVNKNILGRLVSIVDRVTFVIDGDGQVVEVIRGVKPEEHALRALKAVQTLSNR